MHLSIQSGDATINRDDAGSVILFIGRTVGNFTSRSMEGDKTRVHAFLERLACSDGIFPLTFYNGTA